MSADTCIFTVRIKMISKTMYTLDNTLVIVQWVGKIQGYRNAVEWLCNSSRNLLQDDKAIRDSLNKNTFAVCENETSTFMFDISSNDTF